MGRTYAPTHEPNNRRPKRATLTGQSILSAVPNIVTLSKLDTRRAMVRHHFAPCANVRDAFERLRSVQFDPIAPVGCNHDLVLQSRVASYRVGDWQRLAYKDRFVYDGWDKQASLVPFEGWPLRRIFHRWHRGYFQNVFDEHPDAIQAILKELETRGPLLPRECEFQERRADWKSSWHGPNVSKQVMRALWHCGQVMTTGRRAGHHVYDLTERVVPPALFSQPLLSEADTVRGLVSERHRSVGILRPNAPPEVWSFHVKAAPRKVAIDSLIAMGEIVPVDIEGVKAHATPAFLAGLDSPSLPPRVAFVAPLDQFVWDRGMIAHVFGFDYVWEIYVPEPRRRWGYYVLPVRYGDELVARVEFSSRKGILELRRWHFEAAKPGPKFFTALKRALRDFMKYCSATSIQVAEGIDPKIRAVADSISPPLSAPAA